MLEQYLLKPVIFKQRGLLTFWLDMENQRDGNYEVENYLPFINEKKDRGKRAVQARSNYSKIHGVSENFFDNQKNATL